MPGEGNYATGVEGILKLVTIVLGVISLGCGIPGYDKDLMFEEYFFGAVIACLVASVVFYPVFSMAASLDSNRGIRFLDFFYHVILGIILVVASGMMLSSAVKHRNSGSPWGEDDNPNHRNFNKKVSAGSIALINGIVYFAASVLVISKRNEDEMSFSRNYPKGG